MSADRREPAYAPETDRLLLDVMLGKLAVYLRMGGYDAAYAGDRGVESDAAVRALALDEDRVLLSRDVGLVRSVEDAVLLAERRPAAQLDELRAAGFALELPDHPRRCGRCNGRLERVPDGSERITDSRASPDEHRESDRAERPDYAPAPEEFDCWRCVDCGQWFWKGSHWDRVGQVLDDRTR